MFPRSFAKWPRMSGHRRTKPSERIRPSSAKAQELGELRHSQQASVHQLIAEYRLLGGILTTLRQEELTRLGLSPAAREAVEVVCRLNEAIWILTQTTVDTFVAKYTETIGSHSARLESFNRMVSHELRQPLGTLIYALPLVRVEVGRGDTERFEHFLGVMERNIRRLVQQMEQLEHCAPSRVSRMRLTYNRSPSRPSRGKFRDSCARWLTLARSEGLRRRSLASNRHRHGATRADSH